MKKISILVIVILFTFSICKSQVDFYFQKYNQFENNYKTFVMLGNYNHQPEVDDSLLFNFTLVNYYLTNDTTVLTNLIYTDTITEIVCKSFVERGVTEYINTDLTYNYLVLTVNNDYIFDNNPNNNYIVYDLSVSNLLSLNNINDNIYIFPNPTTDIIHIEYDNINSIDIYDLYGNIIISTNENLINVEFLNEGVYILNINNLYKTKFIKK